MGIKERNLINATLISGRVGRTILVTERHDSAIEGIMNRHADDLFRESEGLTHKGDIVGAQTTQEATVVFLLVGDVLVREHLGKESRQTAITLLGRMGRVVGVFGLKGAALVNELGVGAAEVADPGIQDLGDGGDLALEGLKVARGIAAHVSHEDARAAGSILLGGDDGFHGGERERDGLFDEDVFAGLEAGDGERGVAFIGGEDEDDLHVGVVDDFLRGGGFVGDEEFGGAVVDCVAG